MGDYSFRGQRDDEDVLLVIKQNAWVFAKTGFYILIGANIVVFSFIMLGMSGIFSYLLAIFVIMVGILIVYKWYLWSNSIYILTNQRIIEIKQDKLFHRLIIEMELAMIQDISTEQKGAVQTFLNFGSIHIKTASSNAGMEMTDVTDPYETQQQIVKAKNLMKNDFKGKMEFRDNFGK